MGIAALILIFSLVMVNRFTVIRKQKRVIQAEKERGDELLELTTVQKQELERLNRVKDRLFSVIGHDMRKPVNSLISFTQLLDNGNLSAEKQQVYALDLKNTLANTANMMDSLLNWAWTQMQGYNPVMEKFDVLSVINQELLVFRARSHTKDNFNSKHYWSEYFNFCW